MALKKIYSFKAMTKYANYHYAAFGFEKAPSSKRIRRRFLIYRGLFIGSCPNALACRKMDKQIFSCSWCFIDKSVFSALGG